MYVFEIIVYYQVIHEQYIEHCVMSRHYIKEKAIDGFISWNA